MTSKELINANIETVKEMIEAGAGYGDIRKALGSDKKNSLFHAALKRAGFAPACEYKREKVDITEVVEVGNSYGEQLEKHFGHTRFGQSWNEDGREYVYVYAY